MSHAAALHPPLPVRAATSWPPRLLLAGAVLLAAVAGAYLSADAASAQAARAAGPELARLLQAMAVLKAVMAAGAVWLVDWRLRYAARPALVAAYVLASALMAASPGVMWHLGHVMAGGALFHAGLAVLVILGFTDRATGRQMLAAAVTARRGRLQAGGRT